MNKKQRIIINIMNIILGVIMVLGMIFLLDKLESFLKIICYLCIFFFTLATPILIYKNKEALSKTCFLLNVITFIVLGTMFILNITGLFENLNDVGHIKDLIKKSGPWGYLVCFLIQLLQVVILPAPTWIFVLAISAVYGTLQSFIISTTAVLVGSYICFYIGRKLGQKAVIWCAGEESTIKYTKIIDKKGKVPFILMQLLPFFPDDILCMVAGLSTMNITFFSIIMFIVKPLNIGIICIFGSGSLIPFSGWGIPVWLILILGLIILCYYYFKNQDKIDNYIKDKFNFMKGEE